jgi:hypothetical protein
MISRYSLAAAAIAVAGMFGLAQSARAELFDIGSNFTVSGQNSAGGFSDTVKLQDGTTTVDGGALNLTISIVPDGMSEWLVFDYQALPLGSPLMTDTSDDWSLNETGLDAAVPVNFDGAYAAFLDSSGNTITPTSSLFAGYTVGADPVPGEVGTGLVNKGFTDDISAGPLPLLGAYIDPFDQLDSYGVTSASVDGWEQALEFAPQTPTPTVPEPRALPLVCLGVLGIAGVALRRRKQAA